MLWSLFKNVALRFDPKCLILKGIFLAYFALYSLDFSGCLDLSPHQDLLWWYVLLYLDGCSVELWDRFTFSCLCDESYPSVELDTFPGVIFPWIFSTCRVKFLSTCSSVTKHFLQRYVLNFPIFTRLTTVELKNLGFYHMTYKQYKQYKG